MLTLSQLLKVIEEGQVAKAEFGDSYWYVIKLNGFLWYWYPAPEWSGEPELKGEKVGNVVPLTYSNLQAYYTIIEGE